MTINRKYQKLCKQKKEYDDMAIELWDFCLHKVTLWKTLYFTITAIVAILTLGFDFVSTFLGGEAKYTVFLHNLTIVTAIVDFFQIVTMLILPFNTWQKFEKLESQFSDAYSEYEVNSKTKDMTKCKAKLGKEIKNIIHGTYQMNTEIANASNNYFKSVKNGKKDA